MADYRSQSTVESDFRQMKDPKVVSFSPMFHWTDHNIRVHAFYCVLALTVARLMVREADHAGHAHERARNSSTPSPGSKKPCSSTKETGAGPEPDACSPRSTPPQRRLYDLFGLDHYAPGHDHHAGASPPPGPPSMRALRQRRPVHVCYHGHDGCICPHALGWKTASRCCSATRPAATPAPERSPPTLTTGGAACSSTRSTTSGDTNAPWGTADNYNPAHPFPAIDQVAHAVRATQPLRPS